jgi:hypothetical protein
MTVQRLGLWASRWVRSVAKAEGQQEVDGRRGGKDADEQGQASRESPLVGWSLLVGQELIGEGENRHRLDDDDHDSQDAHGASLPNLAGADTRLSGGTHD